MTFLSSWGAITTQANRVVFLGGVPHCRKIHTKLSLWRRDNYLPSSLSSRLGKCRITLSAMERKETNAIHGFWSFLLAFSSLCVLVREERRREEENLFYRLIVDEEGGELWCVNCGVGFVRFSLVV